MAEGVPPERAQPGRSLARRDFEQVIRRAAELSAREGDANEQLTEEEVLRIGQELGLSAQHVRRAMYELPELAVAARWYDPYFGPAVFSVARVVPARSDPTLKRIQDYLITREYLQIARRRGHSVGFIPAEDTLSHLARAFMRPSSRHAVSRASRLILSVEPLPTDDSHIRFDVDLSDDRRERVRSGAVFGGLAGVLLGSAAAALTAGFAPPVLGPVPEILAFGGTLVGTCAASISAAAARFKHRVTAAKMELTSLLDRVEHGESLEPPPAPWRRRLQLRWFGGQ